MTPPSVRLSTGVTVDLEAGDRVVFDGTAAGDVRVLSHAHADHQVGRNAGPVVCSPLTAALVETRQNTSIEVADRPATVDLLNAGHVSGSRAALVTDPDTGRRYLYTGDVCPRDRFYLEGFDPPDVDVDVLIVEATYGTPNYRLPPTDEVLGEIHDWLADTRDRIAVMYGYSLGRAQKLQRIADDADRGRVFVTDTVADVNAVIESHLDVSFDVELFGDGPDATDESDLQPGDVLVAPAGAARGSAVGRLLERDDVVTAGFSGWAIDRSFRFRRGYDAGFPLTDHADFGELVGIVRAVDPDRVYTHHGFAEAFARHLTTEYGYETRALKKHQATLADF